MTLRITIRTQIWQPQPLGHVYMTLERSHTHFCSLFCIHKTSLKKELRKRTEFKWYMLLFICIHISSRWEAMWFLIQTYKQLLNNTLCLKVVHSSAKLNSFEVQKLFITKFGQICCLNVYLHNKYVQIKSNLGIMFWPCLLCSSRIVFALHDGYHGFGSVGE